RRLHGSPLEAAVSGVQDGLVCAPARLGAMRAARSAREPCDSSFRTGTLVHAAPSPAGANAMVDLALKTLLYDRVRFAITVAGVAFAVSLVLIQGGLFL